MMIRLIIHNADRLALSMKGRRDRVHQAMLNRVDFLTDELYEKIIGKLSGGVLNKRSGKLIESIRKEEAGDYRVTAYQTSIGKFGSISGYVTQDLRVAPYGAVQEFGGTHPFTIVPKKKEYLFFVIGGVKVSFMAQGKKKEFVRGRSSVFTKLVNRPRPLSQRSYMRSSLDEMRGEIGTAIKAVVRTK